MSVYTIIQRCNIFYTYDQQDRIIKCRIQVPPGGLFWTIYYQYQPLLKIANVKDNQDQDFLSFRYKRDSNGRLKEKEILNTSGIIIGRVHIIYHANTNKIIRLHIQGRVDLPLWDPIVDK